MLKSFFRFVIQEILKFFGQIVRALHHIHYYNILHRDMKTHNILLDRRKKVVKICDFGISKHLQTQTSAMTVLYKNKFTLKIPQRKKNSPKRKISVYNGMLSDTLSV